MCAVTECLKNTTTLAATAGRMHFESGSAMQQSLGALWQRVCSLAHPQAGRYCSYARTLRDSLSDTHSHTLTRSGSPQPLGGTSVLHCHNKSLNKQQQHGKPQHQHQDQEGSREAVPRRGPGGAASGSSSNSTSVVNTKAEHDADADADVDVDAGIAVAIAALPLLLLLHSAYRAEFPV